VLFRSAASVPDARQWEDIGIPALLAILTLVAAFRPGSRWLQVVAPSTYLIASAVYYVRLIGI
jgi:hypothetical protein